MRFSLIIPTYNRRETLRRCLAAATSQDYPDYEVIVVDDASTDGSREMVRQEFPQVRYFRQEVNQGPAAARNRGIEAATGEIVAFTDDDCLVPPDFLSHLADGYRRYPKVAGVGGYLDASDEVLRHNLFAQYEEYITHQVHKAGPEPYLGGFECPAGGTNSMSYRRDVLEAVGGFDETFPVPGGEDADLKWRVVQAGSQLLYVPIKVIHLQPYTLQHFWHQRRTHGRGAVHFERKYQGQFPSSTRLALRGGVRLARWIRDLFRMGPRLATVKLIAGLADVSGQWQEKRRLRCR
jgi:GT2 family glycosyltransferase